MNGKLFSLDKGLLMGDPGAGVEAIEEKKEMVHDILVEAMEDVAMIRAIRDGEDSGLVDRDEIFGILTGSEGSA